MDTDELHLDGNAIAGILGEIFTTMEITSAERVCQSCGSHAAMGAHRVYKGAGIALRCPVCDDLSAVIGMMGDHGYMIELRGRWYLKHSM